MMLYSITIVLKSDATDHRYDFKTITTPRNIHTSLQSSRLATQLNSTQLTTPKEEWINKRKEAKKLIYIPDSLVNSLDVS